MPDDIKPWVNSKLVKEAFEKGQIYERECINRFNAILIENNRYADVKHSTEDAVYQAQLLAYFVTKIE
jgi:hypothetical protein